MAKEKTLTKNKVIMKRKLFYLWMMLAVVSAAFTTSCEVGLYDDTALMDRLDDFDSRISALETLVKASESGDYITSITPTDDGYEIVFSKYGKANVPAQEKSEIKT